RGVFRDQTCRCRRRRVSAAAEPWGLPQSEGAGLPTRRRPRGPEVLGFQYRGGVEAGGVRGQVPGLDLRTWRRGALGTQWSTRSCLRGALIRGCVASAHFPGAVAFGG